jgi:hypothetical protein
MGRWTFLGGTAKSDLISADDEDFRCLIGCAVTLQQASYRRAKATGVWRIARLLRIAILSVVANESTGSRNCRILRDTVAEGEQLVERLVGRGGASGTAC